MDDISDPLGDRVMKNVPTISRFPLTKDQLWHISGKTNYRSVPNIQLLRDHLIREGHINKPEVLDILKEARYIFESEPNLVRIKDPVIIVGDIHGQFYDLIHMFEKVVDSRNISDINLLFLGDYVDRGQFSIEVLLFLFSLKINYPKNVYMLRGNHESAAMAEHFTFREEVLHKYEGDEQIYEQFISSFEALPLAAEVNGDYLCMHGGVSPELDMIEDINKIDRFIEPPLKGFLCDLLWSDPCADKEARSIKYQKNIERECSYKFGLEPVKQLLKKNNLLSIIRAHQVQIDGYKMHRWGGSDAFPSVITVFSAPNYCGSYKNKGAVVLIENLKMSIKQYKDVVQPYHLPKNIDLFAWSLPFLADKIGEMMENALNQAGVATKDKSSELEVNQIINQLSKEQHDQALSKVRSVKDKIISVARFGRMLKNSKQNAVELAEYKKYSHDGRLPRGLLLKTMTEIKSEVNQFLALKKLDFENEKMPIKKVQDVLVRRESLKTRNNNSKTKQ